MTDNQKWRASKAPAKQGADLNAASGDPMAVRLGRGRSGIGDPSARFFCLSVDSFLAQRTDGQRSTDGRS